MRTSDCGDSIADVLAELKAAKTKHPGWPEDVVHQAAIIAEEAGEVVRAALQETYEEGDIGAVYHEAKQTAAMCLRLMDAWRNPDLEHK